MEWMILNCEVYIFQKLMMNRVLQFKCEWQEDQYLRSLHGTLKKANT